MKKIDLHIHTLQTISDSQFEFSLDSLTKYVIEAEIDAIAITNHNCFDIEQFEIIQEALKNSATVFPGIEVNIGQNAGHLIVISCPQMVADFSVQCEKIKASIKNKTDSISAEEFKNIFGDLSKFLLIPHYDKSPSVDRRVIDDLKDFIICGEVSSVKKFIYCQKDNESLTPLYFSDWRPVKSSPFPVRQTWIDIDDINISALKLALSDKTKVQLSCLEGNNIFQVLPGINISTGLTVIIGERSSGKSYTLDQISKSYDNIKYIRQFSLLETEPNKASELFKKTISEKQSNAMRDYFLSFSHVVDDVSAINLSYDETLLNKYLASLIKHASEVNRSDMFSKCSLYSENDYSIDSLDGLKELVDAVEKLLDARQYKEVIEQTINRAVLISLHKSLIQTFIEEKQIALKKAWINNTVQTIKKKLQRKTADTIVENFDFYEFQIHRKKIDLFCQLAKNIRKPSVISEQNIEGFKIQVSKCAFSGSQELKAQSGKKVAFSDIFDYYNSEPYKYLRGIVEKEGIESKDYYQFFAKIDYKILNQYGFEVSGGERAEYNLLQEINDANNYDMLLIDEPESSFDNIFLRDRVNHIIKDISTRLPVVIVTHNNTVGASIKPDYIIHTRRKIVDREIKFEVYSGYPGSKVLESKSGGKIQNIDVTMDCLEAGQDAYEERRKDYEMLRD